MKLLNKANVAMVAAEFLGTALLVTMFLILIQTTAVSYFIATSVAVTLAVIYMVFGSVSGAHVNPAVTFGMWTARKIGAVRGISFVIAQVLGGLCAFELYQYLVGHTVVFAAKSNVFDWRVLIAEGVGTAIFVMAYAAVVSRREESLHSAVTVGAAFFVGIMIAAVAAHGFLNPAVAIGAKSFTTTYMLGPLLGGLVGYNLYNELFGSGKSWLATAMKKK